MQFDISRSRSYLNQQFEASPRSADRHDEDPSTSLLLCNFLDILLPTCVSWSVERHESYEAAPVGKSHLLTPRSFVDIVDV